jgi:predicted ribosome quality control (RQC) complex YloA/Tae2 family protein
LSAISLKERDANGLEDNRIKGELIIANIYRIKKGSECVEVENYYDGTTVRISLDANLTPSENAEVYYKRYNKQKRALVAIKPQKEQAESEVEYLTSVLDEITLSETEDELKSVRAELGDYGLMPTEKQKSNRKRDVEEQYRLYEIDGFTVKSGRNNTENDRLIATARGESIWLHAKDYHSTHIIIETNGNVVPETVIVKASEICAYYSKGRDGGKCEVVYTKRKNVKKPPRSKPGFVVYTDYRSVTVVPKSGSEFIKSK